MPAIVTFTDYGYTDPYLGLVKAVLYREAPGIPVIDLINDLPAFRVQAAASLLGALHAVLDEYTVCLAVVDPGVGGHRKPVVLEAGRRWYVGPHNGLLDVVMARNPDSRVYEIDTSGYEASDSFHGRDIFAPVAACIAAGKDWPQAGEISAVPVNPGRDEPRGEVIYVDHYGNLFTDLVAADIPETGIIRHREHEIRYARVFSEVQAGQLFWYRNSIGLLEISANQSSASDISGISIGDRIELLNNID